MVADDNSIRQYQGSVALEVNEGVLTGVIRR